MAHEISDKIHGDELRALARAGDGSAEVLIVLEAPEPQITLMGEQGNYLPRLAPTDGEREQLQAERFEELQRDLGEAGIAAQPLPVAGSFAATLSAQELAAVAAHPLVRGIWPNRRHLRSETATDVEQSG